MSLKVLHTKNLSIFKQLNIEEAFLRAHEENLCLINEGSEKMIVLGASNKMEEFINEALIKKNPIPVIRRFSSGGSVIVNEHTIFISFIFSKDTLNFSYPKELFQWTKEFYQKIFPNISLKENDFVIENYKCGGNAQYIKKNRWLHHTSFLWDYCKEEMKYLLIPKKMPFYRKKRDHKDFLCRLKDHFPEKDLFIEKIKKELRKRFFFKKVLLQEVEDNLKKPSFIKTKKYF